MRIARRDLILRVGEFVFETGVRGAEVARCHRVCSDSVCFVVEKVVDVEEVEVLLEGIVTSHIIVVKS